MSLLLLSLVLLLQGIPVQPTQSGTVTGVLLAADGKPAPNVRIAAVPQTESLEQPAGGPTLSSIAETDAQGRYKLEGIPPGRYYIAAGRLDLPTFYPGTQSMGLGRVVAVGAGATVTDINFAMNATSAGRADPSSGLIGPTLLDLPIDVRVEGGGKLPVLSAGNTISIQLTPIVGTLPGVSVPINASRALIPPPSVDYRVTIDGLPEGYKVQSLRYGSAELPERILKLTGLNPIAGPSITPAPPQTLSIVLDSTASSVQGPGIRIRGSLPPNTIRPVSLAGVAGTVFSDGAFEFHNVLPGRYVLMAPDGKSSARALAASLVVGTNDLDDVQLSSSTVLPAKPRSLTAEPGEARNSRLLPLAALRGRVVDAETGSPLTGAIAFLVGDGWAKFEIGADGRFEFQNLLPGSYDVEIQAVGYPAARRSVIIEEQDLNLEMNAG